MGLIKASSAPVNLTAFSLKDIETHAASILIRAREKAEEIVATAKKQAESIKTEANRLGTAEGRKQGSAEGFAAGKTSGHAEALAQHSRELTALVAALTQAADNLEQHREELLADGLHEVVNLSCAIARRVTKRQGMIDTEVLKANLKEAMSLALHSADVRIALNPAERKKLESELPELRLAWPQLKHVELVEDASIAPGGARVFTLHGQVDGDLNVQLDRLIAELMPDRQADANVRPIGNDAPARAS